MGKSMNVSIVYTGVRVSPDVIVEIAAVADGKPIRADLDRAAIDHLLGPAVGDEKVMMAALGRHRQAICRAIEAYVFARGAPFDGHLTLTWQDISAFAENSTAAA
jgi:hypothetical protein